MVAVLRALEGAEPHGGGEASGNMNTTYRKKVGQLTLAVVGSDKRMKIDFFVWPQGWLTKLLWRFLRVNVEISQGEHK